MQSINACQNTTKHTQNPTLCRKGTAPWGCAAKPCLLPLRIEEIHCSLWAREYCLSDTKKGMWRKWWVFGVNPVGPWFRSSSMLTSRKTCRVQASVPAFSRSQSVSCNCQKSQDSKKNWWMVEAVYLQRERQLPIWRKPGTLSHTYLVHLIP